MPLREIEGIEELRGLVGQEVGSSDWFIVTHDLIRAFADVTGDQQWIHCDPERAKTESPYGTTIAHGFLTLSLLSQLHGQSVKIRGDFKMAINYGLNRVRFPAPVPASARIRTHSTLQSLEEIQGGYQLIWAIMVEIENGPKPALVAEWITRLYA